MHISGSRSNSLIKVCTFVGRGVPTPPFQTRNKMQMKRIFKWVVFAIVLQALPLSNVFAQKIENGKLISWADASGSITIPEDVTEIAENCFYTPGEPDPDGWGDTDPISNTAITSVDFKNVVKIGKNAFKGCTGIVSIMAPKVTEIAEEAFDACSSLEALALPAITKLEKRAFANCSAMTNVSLGKSLASTGANPFTNCTMLKNLQIEAGAEGFYTSENALIRKTDGVLVAVAGGIEQLTLDGRCKKVGESAMFGCSRLTKVTLPEATVLGDKSLNGCSSLAELIVPKLEEVENNSFITMNGVGSLRVMDIHLSPNFKGFNGAFNDKESTTLYVASEEVKTRLSKELRKTKIIVGAPSVITNVTITYSFNSDGGKVESWTTGAVAVVSGQTLPTGSTITFKAIPFFDYYVASWTLNGTDISSSVENNMYEIASVTEDINLNVTFRKKDEGCYIFYRSLAPSQGTISCSRDGGINVPYGEKVPLNSNLKFTASPRRGYRVTDWSKEVGEGSQISYEVISGQNGKTTYECKAEDGLDIAVNFDRMTDHFIVKFSSFNTDNGTLTAALQDGSSFESGDALPKGSKIIFTAHPIGANKVEEWQLNSETVSGHRELTYVVESLSSDIEVNVLCSQSGEPDPDAPVIQKGHLISWNPEGAAILPGEVTHIDAKAFEGANKMTSLTLNKDLKYIGEQAFLYATALRQFEVPAENPHFTAEDGVLYNKEKTLLIAYPAGREGDTYQIIASALGIMPGAFATCPLLKNVTVAIDNTALKSVDGALYTQDGATLLFFPTRPIEGEEAAIKLPEGLQTIGRLALSYHPAVKGIKLPASLRKIEAQALAFNPVLASVGYEENVSPGLESVGDSAFYYGRSLLLFPHIPTLKSLGKGVFGICNLLEEIHIPDGCTIGKGAFEKCQSIKRVFAYDSKPADIEADAFSDIVFLDEATLHVKPDAVDAYSQADGWKIFNHIKGSIDTRIETIEHSNYRIYKVSDGWLVEGFAAGLNYTTCTVSGELLTRSKTQQGQFFVPAPHAGLAVLLHIEGHSVIKLMR